MLNLTDIVTDIFNSPTKDANFIKRALPDSVATGFIQKLYVRSHNWETWTAIKTPRISDPYLISNVGRCFSLADQDFVYLWKGKQNYYVLPFDGDWHEIPVQKLVYFNFANVSRQEKLGFWDRKIMAEDPNCLDIASLKLYPRNQINITERPIPERSTTPHDPTGRNRSLIDILLDKEKDEEYLRKYAKTSRTSFEKAKSYLLKVTEEGEVWTRCKYHEITRCFLLSNFGKVYSLFSNVILKQELYRGYIPMSTLTFPSPGEPGKYLTVSVVVQKGLFLHFKDVPDSIIANHKDYYVANIDGDRMCLDLDFLVISTKRIYQLAIPVFMIRQIQAFVQQNPHTSYGAIAKRFETKTLIVRRIAQGTYFQELGPFENLL